MEGRGIARNLEGKNHSANSRKEEEQRVQNHRRNNNDVNAIKNIRHGFDKKIEEERKKGKESMPQNQTGFSEKGCEQYIIFTQYLHNKLFSKQTDK